ncbi:MAG: hypothetical protein RBR35_13820 [Salinivirgaceae bacterium]|nr:hypothetical protein [Salinivirgaceae bacterium]MDY0281624.1 hypothetical protein [Salinivirgaceae bacterium]
MRKLIILAILLTGMMACNNNKAELEQLKAENLQLKNDQGRNEEALFSFAETFNGIQNNLDSIAAKEGMISKLAVTGEKSTLAHQTVNEQINTIYDMMIKNRKQLDNLSKQSKSLGKKNSSLDAIIDRMNKQMEEKVVEVELLRGQLETMRYQVTGLGVKVDSLNILTEVQQGLIEEQISTITEQKEAMNTVYFAIGTMKELEANNVIDKEGGFLGMRKTGKMADDLNTKYFEASDKYKKRTFFLGSKRVKIVTSHPTDSYVLHGDKVTDSLTITDPDKFWKQSRYLVISVK